MRAPLRPAFAVALALGTLLAGCKTKVGESALDAAVEVTAPLAPTCVTLQVTVNGSARVTQTLVFDGSKRSFKVGIKQGDLPTDVTLRAFASAGAAGCSEPRTVLSASPAVAAKFPTGGVGQVSLVISAAPPADLDADGDAHVAATSGGDDCDDGKAAVHPGQAQDCSSPLDTDCNGQAGCLDSACASAASCLSGGAQLAFLNPPIATGPDACAGPLTVSLRTSGGLPVNAAADVPVTLSAAPAGLSFFSDASCGTASASVTIASGTNSGDLWMKGSTQGSYLVTAASGALAPATQTETITDAAVASLAFTTPARTVTAGACSQELDLATLDAAGNPTTVATAMQVALTASQGGVTFYADAACGTPLAGNLLSFAAGASTGRFWLTATRALATTLSASLSGLPPPTQPLTVNAAAADHLAFVTQPQGVASGACSGVVIVEARDVDENPAAPPGGQGLTLSEMGVSGFTFYSDAACATAVTAPLTFSGPQAYFHFVGTLPGTATMTATSGSLTPATQDAVVGVGPAAALAFTSPSQSAPSGQCSAQPVVVQVRDATGNPVTVTGTAVTVNLSAMPSAGFTLYSDAGCTNALTGSATVPVGSSSMSFWFKGTPVGPVVITASATGLSSDLQTESVTAGPPTQLVFTSTAQSKAAGTCTQFDLAARDGAGNPATVAADTPITLSANPMTVAFSAAPGCSPAGTTVTMAAGSGTVSFYGSGMMVGTPMLSAAAPFGTAHQSFTVTAGAPTGLTVTTPARTGIQSGACSGAITVQLHDGFGNVTPAPSPTDISLASGAASGFAFYAGNSCGGSAVATATVPQGMPSVTVSFKGAKAESFQLTFSATGLGSVQQAASIIAGAASQLVFTTPSRFGVAAAVCSPVLTLERLDAAGNPAVGPALPVALGGTGNRTFFTDPACSMNAGTNVNLPSGQSTVDFYFLDAMAESFTIAATANGVAPASQLESVNAGGVSKLVITSAARTVAAGQCSGAVGPVTVERQDASGNPASPGNADTVDLSWGGAGAMQFFTDSSCATSPVTSADILASNASVNVYFKSPRAEAALLTAASGILGPDSQSETVTPGTASQLAFTNGPFSLDAATCSSTALTVQSQDALGNPANVGSSATVDLTASGAGAPGTFSGMSSCTPTITSVVIPSGMSTASFFFMGSAPGTLTLTATATAAGLGVKAQDETINPRPPTQLALASSGSPAEAGACVAVTVTREDTTGAPTAPSTSTAVTLSVLPSSGLNLYSDGACSLGATGVTITAGQSQATYYVKGITGGTGTTGATYSLGAASSGLTGASLDFVVLQMVRRGTCTLLHNQNSVTCAVQPAIPGADISRTFLVYQGSDVYSQEDRDDVECHLTTASATVNVVCTRVNNPGGSNPDVAMAWQTVSSAKSAANGGITVQHLSGTYTNNSTLNPLDVAVPTAVDLGQTFVLSGTSQSGTNNRAAGFLTAQLTSSANARLSQTGGSKMTNNGSWSIEVVTFGGAAVTRGVLTPNSSDASYQASASSADLTRTGLFFSARTDDTGTGSSIDNFCKRRFRGEVTNGTTLTFARGAGLGGGCTNNNLVELAWEEVLFPSGTLVQPVAVTVGGSQSTGSGSLSTAVDVTRTVLLMAGSGPGGQSAGETNYWASDQLADTVGVPSFTDPSTVQVRRPVNPVATTSLYTVFATQLTP